MTMQTVSLNTSYGGTQGVYRHASSQTRTDMTFSVYVPPTLPAPGCRWSGISPA